MKKYFLPVGIPIFFILAWLLPEAGAWLKHHYGVYIFVVTIFLFNGYSLKLSSGNIGKKFIAAFFTGFLISFAAGPLLAYAASLCIPLEEYLLYGLMVISAVPPTLSSAIVISELSGGEVSWAILCTIGFNLLGIFVIPYSLKIMFSTTGPFSISVGAIVLKLTLLVLLPVIIGYIAKKQINKKLSTWMTYIPSVCVLLTIFAFVGNSKDVLVKLDLKQLPLVVIAVSVVHIGLMIINYFAAKLLSLSPQQRNSMIFVSSQKTLPLSMTILGIILDKAGLAILTCVAFHFFQLLVDSILAGYMIPKQPEQEIEEDTAPELEQA